MGMEQGSSIVYSLTIILHILDRGGDRAQREYLDGREEEHLIGEKARRGNCHGADTSRRVIMREEEEGKGGWRRRMEALLALPHSTRIH